MDDCAQWNPVYDRKDPGLKRCSNPGPVDQQASAYTTQLPGLLSLGDGSIETEICLKEPLNPKTTYQPNVPMLIISRKPTMSLKRKWNY